MRWPRTLFEAAAAAVLLWSTPLHAADKQTVCTITVNSADEKEAFRRHLPESKYRFVELVERGRDLATGIGVVAGAAIGCNSGRGGDQQTTARNVQRCSSTPGAMRPTYWDVTYNFRGVEHHVQTTSPPGATVSVNEQGEPRA